MAKVSFSTNFPKACFIFYFPFLSQEWVLDFIIYVPGISWDDYFFLLLLIDNHFLSDWKCNYIDHIHGNVHME